jgi:hypothetical protein
MRALSIQRSKFVKNKHARYGVRIIHWVHVIYTSKGVLKRFGVRVIHRCALSTAKNSTFYKLHCYVAIAVVPLDVTI